VVNRTRKRKLKEISSTQKFITQIIAVKTTTPLPPLNLSCAGNKWPSNTAIALDKKRMGKFVSDLKK
jgi:hypothetical protein